MSKYMYEMEQVAMVFEWMRKLKELNCPVTEVRNIWDAELGEKLWLKHFSN